MAVLRVALQMALGILLTLGLQLLLRAWTPPARRARGWNGATWGAALYAFGPASMLGFCWVLRGKGVRGAASAIGRGVLWAVVIAAMLQLVDVGFVGRFGTLRERRDALGIEAPPRPPPAKGRGTRR